MLYEDSLDSDDRMSDVVWTLAEINDQSTNPPSRTDSSVYEWNEVDVDLERALIRMSDHLRPVKRVALIGEFEYFLNRIGCNETLSDNVLSSETYNELKKSCSELWESSRSGKLNFDKLVEMCRALTDTLARPPRSLDRGLLVSKILQFCENTGVNIMQVDTNVHEIRPEVHAIISDGWDEAWETKFENRALENFKVYLQTLWIERKKKWRRNHPPTYSLCATIVQSSCAGKSRLVYSLGSHILAPVLNLLRETGPYGMDGFPQGDETILNFLRDRLALVTIDEPEKEYIEQLTQPLPKRGLRNPRPREWLLARRVTALALIIGLFEALHAIISRPSQTLQTVAEELKLNTETRNQFLRSIVKFAQAFLEKSPNKKEFSEMLTRAAQEEKLELSMDVGGNVTGGNPMTKGTMIAEALAKCSKTIVRKLFELIYCLPAFSPLQVKSEDSQQIPDDWDGIRLLLVFDEASTLIDQHYYNSFRWIFDNVLQMAWETGKSKYSLVPLPFMAIFLGTNSKVADFAPPGEHASYRYFMRSMVVPRPFTSLAWDVHVGKPFHLGKRVAGLRNASLRYNHLPTMDWLCRFGRPVWYARWRSMFEKSDDDRLREKDRIIQLVQEKLCHIKGGTVQAFKERMVTYAGAGAGDITEDIIQASSAVLAVLVGLDFDFTAPSRAVDLVASRLRWALASNDTLTRFLTTYPSEPVLAEGANELFFSEVTANMPAVYTGVLKVVLGEIQKGNYDFGSEGELTARILCIMARHKSLNGTKMQQEDVGAPVLESHRFSTVTSFLEALFNENGVASMSKDRVIWTLLGRCFINFSHFTEELCDTNAHSSLTRDGLFKAFLRGRAIQCKQAQAGIDLVIPMVILKDKRLSDPVSSDDISAIIIQVKNKKKDDFKFSATNIHKRQFDLRHFHGLGIAFYLGIWMSFRSKDNDFDVITLSTNNWDIYGPEESAMSTRPKRVTGYNFNKTDNESNQSVLRGRNFSVRGRGFMEIYNPDLPLNQLWELIEHAPFSTHIKDIRFTSQRERDEAMRPVWNSSSAEICTNVKTT